MCYTGVKLQTQQGPSAAHIGSAPPGPTALQRSDKFSQQPRSRFSHFGTLECKIPDNHLRKHPQRATPAKRFRLRRRDNRLPRFNGKNRIIRPSPEPFQPDKRNQGADPVPNVRPRPTRSRR